MHNCTFDLELDLKSRNKLNNFFFNVIYSCKCQAINFNYFKQSWLPEASKSRLDSFQTLKILPGAKNSFRLMLLNQGLNN